MIYLQQYDALLKHQSDALIKGTRKITGIFGRGWRLIADFFVKKTVLTINELLISQMMQSKGFLADIEKRTTELKDQDLHVIIGGVDAIIKLNITLKETIDHTFTDWTEKIKDVQTWDPILEETIENYYSVLRILKRQHLKASIETSSLAIESSKCSLTSLQTATYDRRTT